MRSALVLLGSAARASATVLSAGGGGGFATLQSALEAAGPGDVVRVAAGVYGERLVFPNGGDAIAGFRSLEAAPGTRPILDASGLSWTPYHPGFRVPHVRGQAETGSQ